MPRSSPIEHASSMHRHMSVLVQSIMHMAIESTSNAYKCAILTSSMFRAYACRYVRMHAILNICWAVYVAATHVYSQV